MFVGRLHLPLVRVSAGGGEFADRLRAGDFPFGIKVAHAPGGFVSGESTTLMTALESTVSKLRAQGVHIVEEGVFDIPGINSEEFADRQRSKMSPSTMV